MKKVTRYVGKLTIVFKSKSEPLVVFAAFTDWLPRQKWENDCARVLREGVGTIYGDYREEIEITNIADILFFKIHRFECEDWLEFNEDVDD